MNPEMIVLGKHGEFIMVSRLHIFSQVNEQSID